MDGENVSAGGYTVEEFPLSYGVPPVDDQTARLFSDNSKEINKHS